jgi:uncharacterized membrane protein
MSLEPILQAGLPTHIHLAAVTTALAIGSWNMARPKGTAPHKVLGRIFIVAMLVAALSSFGIHAVNRGGYSFLHLLSIFVLITAPLAWWYARSGRIVAHRQAMIGLYVGGLWVPGALTLLPGRVLNRALFGS